MPRPYSRFQRQSRHCSFCIVAADGRATFYVDPEALAVESEVLGAMVANSSFVEGRRGQVDFPDERADDLLELLQCTIPGGSQPPFPVANPRPRKPVSVENLGLLIRYADMWLMRPLYERCLRFLADDFPHLRTNIRVTLPMLEAVCTAGIDDARILQPLLGRLAAFGHCALSQARVFENDALSSAVRETLERKAPRNFKDVAPFCRYVEHCFDRVGERRMFCQCVTRLPPVRFVSRFFAGLRSLFAPPMPEMKAVFRVCSQCDEWLCLSCNRRRPCTKFPISTANIIPITL